MGADHSPSITVVSLQLFPAQDPCHTERDSPGTLQHHRGTALLVNPSFRNNSTLTHIHNTHTQPYNHIHTHAHTHLMHTHAHAHTHTSHITHHTPNTHMLSLSTNRRVPVYQQGLKRFLRLLSHAWTPSLNVAISTAHKQRNTGMTIEGVCGVCVCVYVCACVCVVLCWGWMTACYVSSSLPSPFQI